MLEPRAALRPDHRNMGVPPANAGAQGRRCSRGLPWELVCGRWPRRHAVLEFSGEFRCKGWHMDASAFAPRKALQGCSCCGLRSGIRHRRLRWSNVPRLRGTLRSGGGYMVRGAADGHKTCVACRRGCVPLGHKRIAFLPVGPPRAWYGLQRQCRHDSRGRDGGSGFTHQRQRGAVDPCQCSQSRQPGHRPCIPDDAIAWNSIRREVGRAEASEHLTAGMGVTARQGVYDAAFEGRQRVL
mmetsp:Transcript_72883/g.202186  ORF Transcript_72883/g.202186 Transcript_72883/m.202186 type:complete len:240 (-) Transcript_72883:110-829(-)